MGKKQIIIVAVVVVFSFIIGYIGYFVGDAAAVARVNKAIGQSLGDAPTTSTTSKPADLKQIDYGQSAELGQFDFKVESVEVTKEAKSETKSISTTNNTYVIVKLGVTNKRNAPAQLSGFDFKLTDLDKKTSFNINSDVSIELSSSLAIYDKKPAVYMYDDINPNMANEISLVYEVPSDANYGLAIMYKTDGMIMKLK